MSLPAASVSSSSVPQWIKVNGILKRNPAYVKAGGQNSAPAVSSVAVPDKALAIVSVLDTNVNPPGGPVVIHSDATTAALEIIQDSSYTEGMNLTSSQRATLPDPALVLSVITQTFTQYEVPLGMINKLLELMGKRMVFRIDDSGSMQNYTKLTFEKDACLHLKARLTNGSRCRPNDNNYMDPRMTRWEEAENRMHVIIDLITMIPTGDLVLRFFDKSRNTTILRGCKTFQEFADEAHMIISTIFSLSPATMTPLGSTMHEDLYTPLSEVQMTYVLSDGAPSDVTVQQLCRLIIDRPNPELTPLTLLPCGDDDFTEEQKRNGAVSSTKWMEDVEENPRAKFVAEVDDFASERKEILEDQGPVLPYSYGLWLICQLVAALNPHDLDAMDDTRPLSRFSIETILGRQVFQEEYDLYWNSHPIARTKYESYRSRMTSEQVFGNVLLP